MNTTQKQKQLLLTWELGLPEIEGLFEGWLLCEDDGSKEGRPETLGLSEGCDVGQSDMLGCSDGWELGLPETLGFMEGMSEG